MIVDSSRNQFVKAEIHPYADGVLTVENALYRRITVTRDNQVVVDGQIVSEEIIDVALKWVDGLKEAFKIAKENTIDNNKNSADDRGNVVDIYVDGEPTGRIDREAEPIHEIDENETLAWEGGKDEIAVAIEHGYGEEVAIAILCSFLRGDTTAREQAIDYLQVAFTAA